MEVVAEIYKSVRLSLLAYIQSRVDSKTDAEDILQDVFAKVSADVNSLADKQNIRAWIFAVTKNAIVDFYRRKSRQRPAQVREIPDIVPDEYNDETKGLDLCIHRMIDLLPADYRQVMLDSEIGGARQKDLADKYGIPYSSVRSRVQRGRERLKQLFYNCCAIEADARGNILDATPRSTRGDSDCVSCN